MTEQEFRKKLSEIDKRAYAEKQEFRKKLSEIDKRAYAKKKALAMKFALTNNPYAIGDILQDHYHIIKVERIRPIMNFLLDPQCAYEGVQLTRKFKPCKRQKDTTMYQANVLYKIKKR